VLVEDFLEVIVADAKHHVGIHGDEAPVAVIGEAPVARLLRQRRDGGIVEAEIEHGIHHARHRRARPRAHRNEQRIFLVAEFLPGDAADLGEGSVHLRLELLRIGFAVLIKICAHLGGDGEAGRHRDAEMRHLGEAGALAAEEVAHAGAALGLAAAEGVHPFAFPRGRRRRGSSFLAILRLHGAPRRFLLRSMRCFGARLDHGMMRSISPARRYPTAAIRRNAAAASINVN
jgi:hypothetical protein